MSTTRLCMGLLIGIATAGAAGAWPTNPPLIGQQVPASEQTNLIEVGVRAMSGNRDGSKFEEYRQYKPGIFGNAIIHDETKDRRKFIDILAIDPGENDMRLSLTFGEYGKFEMNVLHDELPHVFSNTARTIYDGTVRGQLLLPDAQQLFLFAGGVTATQSARLKTALDAAHPVDLSFQQESTGFAGSYVPKDGWRVTGGYNKTRKVGTRPLGLGFGSPGNNFVNVAAPIDQEVHDLHSGLAYRGEGWNVNLAYWGSFFRNAIDTLTIDNPFRATDSVAAGAKQGRTDLDPDNDSHTFTLAGSKKLKLPWPARVSGTVSFGRRTQNDPFIPQTINSAIKSPALILPASLNGATNTELINLMFNGRPTKNVNLTARYRYYDLDAKTPELTLHAHVVNDRTLTIEDRDTHPTAYTKENSSLDGSWTLSKKVTWRAGYEHETWDRPDHREVTTTHEDFWRTGLDWRPDEALKWLVRTDYAYSAKKGSDYNPFAHFHNSQEEDDVTLLQLQSPLLRKFDLADRRQHRAQLNTQYSPRDNVTFGVTGMYGLAAYDGSPLGLQADERFSVGADSAWQINQRTRWTSFFTHEKIRARQLDRFRTRTGAGATAIIFDDPRNDWASDTIDTVNTFGGSLDYQIKPGKWDTSISWVRQKTHGQTLAASVPGSFLPAGAADGGNAVNFPELSDQLDTLSAILRNHLSKELSLQFEYRYDHYDQANFKVDGLQPFMPASNINGNGVVSPSTDIFLGDQIGNYNVHVFALSALQKF